MLRRRAALGAGLLLAAAAPARAQQASDTLRVTWRDAVSDLDPYRNQLRSGLVLAHHVFDCLVDRDPATFQLRPLLALGWRQVDDTTLAFALRPDVRFHDGAAFNADDVVQTVNSVLADPALGVPGLFAWLAGAERVDDMSVRVLLREPFPAALEYLAMALPILPRGMRHGSVGTGPYRVAAIDGEQRITLERFDGYFAGGPKRRPEIDRIAIRQVDDADAAFTDLLADRADWIWQLGPDQFDALAHQPGLQPLKGESIRLGYLSLDAAGRAEPGGLLTRLKVRQAICHALDRPAIAARLADVATRVPDTPCYPTQFGCDAAAATHYGYDPALARALLAEAGLADGFATDLVSYVLPADGQAVRGYLQAVGITARLVQLPVADALARAEAGQAPLFLGSWGSYSINDAAAFLPQFFAGGPMDSARVPALQQLIARAGASGDADVRRDLYSQAIRLITAQALWLPLHGYAATYGVSHTLNFRPSADEIPRFYQASWR